MKPLFIIIDLDGTLVNEKSGQLMSGVEKSLSDWRAEGHYLAVCSNNVCAKIILGSLGILHYFDYVIGHSSSSFKVVEFLECWDFYRFLYRTKRIRWKVHLNRIIFVDNDEENHQELSVRFPPVVVFHSIHDLKLNLYSLTKPPGM